MVESHLKNGKNMVSDKKIIQKSYASWKGPYHSENQDGLLIIEEDNYSLFFVFDGVGSSLNSKKSVDFSNKFISKNHSLFFNEERFDIAMLMYHLNQELVQKFNESGLCTYACLSRVGQEYFYSSMGDTRIYGITNQYVEQLTKDDRLEGYTNVITKCLGLSYIRKSDFVQERIGFNYPQFLVCSDGFHEIFDNDKLFFFETFLLKNQSKINQFLDPKIKSDLKDDSTYILIF